MTYANVAVNICRVMARCGVSSAHLSESLRLLARYNNSMRNSSSYRFVRVIEEIEGQAKKKRRKDEITT
jgi:hypothetical protein